MGLLDSASISTILEHKHKYPAAHVAATALKPFLEQAGKAFAGNFSDKVAEKQYVPERVVDFVLQTIAQYQSQLFELQKIKAQHERVVNTILNDDIELLTDVTANLSGAFASLIEAGLIQDFGVSDSKLHHVVSSGRMK